MLLNLYEIIARSAVPNEHLNSLFAEQKDRTRAKAFKENMLKFGTHLMIQLDEVIEGRTSVKDLLWRESLVNAWSQFFLSLEHLHNFLKKESYEEAKK